MKLKSKFKISYSPRNLFSIWYDKWLREDRQTRLPHWFWHVAICSVVSYLYCTVWKRMDDFTRFSYIFFFFLELLLLVNLQGTSEWGVQLETRESWGFDGTLLCLLSSTRVDFERWRENLPFFIKSFNLVRNLDLCIRFFLKKKTKTITPV